MRSFVTGMGVLLGALAALVGVIWTLMFAWGIWHGGTLRGVHWHIGPSPILAIVVFFAGWEIVGTICFFVVAAPFLGVASLFPDRKAA